MRIDEVIKVLEQERTCVMRQIGAGCDRNCASCDLVMDDSTVLSAYNDAIKSLQHRELLQKTQQLDNKPMANGDRIRAMSDEELAEKMCGHAIDTICDIVCGRDCCAGTEDGCIAKLLDWLKQPAEAE